MPRESLRDENGDEEMSCELNLSLSIWNKLTSFFFFSVQLWKYRFSSQCMSVVHDQVFGARTPNYKVLQQLDRKVRDFYTPPSLQVPGFGGPMADVESAPIFVTFQRYVGYAIKEMSKSTRLFN
jgi:hypothetical protein